MPTIRRLDPASGSGPTNGPTTGGDNGIPSSDGTTASPYPLPAQFPHDLAWRWPLSVYRDAVGPGTESADEFHFACAIATLGVLLGRHWCIKYPYAHYPNFFVCLVGPTGKSRKTSALRAGLEDLLLPIGGQRIPRTLFIAQGLAGSGEGLLTNVADVGNVRGRSMLIYEDELAVILKGLRREGSTLGGFLIQAADAVPIMSLSTRRRPLMATGPTVGMLAASTSEWVEANVIEDDIRGGIVNRILWFYGSDKGRISLPQSPSPALLKKIYETFVWIPSAPAIRPRVMALTVDACEAFDAWYVRERPSLSPLVAAATARAHTQAIRLALLFAILEGRGRVTDIKTEHVEAGIAVSEYCMAVASHLFLTSSKHPDARTDRSLLEALRQNAPKPLNTAALHRIAAPDVSAAHVKRLLDGLGAMGYVRIDRGFVHLR